MSQQSAKAKAPATIANVGPGFDVFGFAMAEPSVTVEVTYGDAEGKGIRITSDSAVIPHDPVQNTAGAALQALMAQYGNGDDLVVHIRAGIPVGSGMGSSAASAVAAVVAGNALFQMHLTPKQLLPFAMAGESVASGTAHADNVAPALFGGMTLVRSHEEVDIVHLPLPEELYYIVVHPHCEVRTADARKALPTDVALRGAVKQWANVGAFVAALYENDYALIGRALEDRLIEPHRGELIPGYAAVKAAAKKAEALGCSIGGSGPSMFAFTRYARKAAGIERAMQEAFKHAGVDSDSWIGLMQSAGATIVTS